MIKKNDLNIRILVIVGIAIAACFLAFPLNKKIGLGLDLKGGMYILLKADTSKVATSQVSDAMGGVVEKVRNRIDAYGVKETAIQVQGTDTILVQIPGIVDREIITKLREVGDLEFKVVESDEEKVQAAYKGTIPDGFEFANYKDSRILVAKNSVLNGADLSESSVGFDQYGVANVRLQFTADGSKKFSKATEENVGRELAIILDGKVMSAPVIREPILSGQAEISGDFSVDEARMLTSVLNSGALPLPLSVEEERSVGPLLGTDSINKGVSASILGIILVFIFMLVYYLFGGVVACICLTLNLLMLLAGMSVFHATLTLPGIAGIILSLGMAVDANVLIYERIREELAMAKPLSVAIKNSFDYTFMIIFDTHFTNLIAAIFLFAFGTGPIRGFATTLSLGVVISFFTTIYVGKTIFSIFLDKGLKKMPMLHMFPPKLKIDFLKPRFIMLTISACIIAAGTINFIQKGESVYGVDFTGGQVLEYKLTPAPKIDEVRKLLSGDPELANISIQDRKDIEGCISIRSKEEIGEKVEKILKTKYQKVEQLSVNKIGPTVGALLKKKALMAVLMSLLGILVYMAFRFKHWDFALAGVIALLYDVLFALGLATFRGYEVDLLTITALLTIAGYSISDTIVVYDRIREIAPKIPKGSLYQIMNIALNATLARTVMTTMTVFLVTASLFILGGKGLEAFSFCLMIGFLSGVYSTVYIASALVLMIRRISA